VSEKSVTFDVYLYTFPYVKLFRVIHAYERFDIFVCILFTYDQYRLMLLAVLFSEAVRDTTLNLRITHKTFICEFSLFHPTLDII